MLRASACKTPNTPSSSSSPTQRSPKPSAFGFPPASRVFVRNLSYSTSEITLKKAFSEIGQIAEVDLIRDKERKKSKGFAFIQYSCQEDALLAIEHMDRKIIDGRLVYVEIARASRDCFSAYPKALGPPSLK